PSTATLLQKRLGLKECGAMDINAACTGFIYALSVADKFIKVGDKIIPISSNFILFIK
ncbi:MAG: hypothetical protein KAQ62_06475, partial [Cyclobacteriaceae bacterium]|nr:hypothetical protein [Cyclobacteriaceae bacterium]